MAKTNNLLLVLNLLHYRKRVTIDDIRRTCKVSSRTAFRYITTLSEANIPILFDKQTGGYRLNMISRVTADHVTVLDGILMKVALCLLKVNSEGTYDKAIESLTRKLDSVLPLPEDERFAGAERLIKANPEAGEIAGIIHNLLLDTAVSEDRTIRVRVTGRSDNSPGTTITHPSLLFKGEWQVSSRDEDAERTVPISEVEEVRLVERKREG